MKIILHREQQHKEPQIIIKVLLNQSLALLHHKDIKTVHKITGKDKMENILCSELAKRFHQASHTPFATAPLLLLMGPFGTNALAQEVLHSTFRCPPQVDEWTQKLLPHLQYVSNVECIQQDFELNLSVDDHSNGWKK